MKHASEKNSTVYYLETDARPEAVEIALEAAGIRAEVKATHLQRAARVTGHVIAGYPEQQRQQAHADALRWIEKEAAQ